MPTIVPQAEKERILRAAIADELLRFHCNACYPKAMDEEVEIAVGEIMRHVSDSWF